jgi:hypothetical protein
LFLQLFGWLAIWLAVWLQQLTDTATVLYMQIMYGTNRVSEATFEGFLQQQGEP